MNLKNVSWILPIFLAVSCSQTPSLNTKPTATSKVLGTVSLGIGENAGGSSVHISPRAALPDNAVTFGSPIFVTYNDGATRYLSARFPVTNNTATAFTNLTLYAYNKSGSGIGGTAIQNLVNFNGANTPDVNAQSLLPIHKTDAGIPNPSIDATNADFQAFNVDDIQVLTAQATTLNTIAAGDTILQYGFVARNATGGRAIAAGGTGTVTIAYKLPDGNVNAAYKLKAGFVLADDTLNTRVTRGLGDTTLAADARATLINADEVFLVGSDTDTTTTPPSQRVTNILTSTSPVCLVQAVACSILTTVSTVGTGTADTITPYSIAITATPAAGTEITSVDIDWGDGGTDNITPPITNATHQYTLPGTYTVTVTANDSNGDVSVDDVSSVTVI
jgi:PKD repeat protein